MKASKSKTETANHGSFNSNPKRYRQQTTVSSKEVKTELGGEQ